MTTKLQQAMRDATKFFRPLTPRQINEHDCFNWAFRVYNRVPGTKIVGHNIDGEGQSCIEYQGRFYDSETPKGKRNWWELPTYRRMIHEA